MTFFYFAALLTVLTLCGHLAERMADAWQDTRYRILRRERGLR